MSTFDDLRNTGSGLSGRILAGMAVFSVFFFLFVATKVVESVNAEDILVVQSPIKGTLTVHVTPGLKYQGFGRITFYPKRDMYEFDGETMVVDGMEYTGSKIRFNDGATAVVSGSVQFDYPLDRENILRLHEKYASPQVLRQQLVEVVVDKAIFMTGPLLSSKESYSERRTDLINWAEDQINNGVYRTQQADIQEFDAMTGETRVVTVATIITDEEGIPLRQEDPQLAIFGIVPRNFAPTDIVYTKRVREQIATQQENIMAVETAIAEAKEAEQRTITVEQQGMANAATAKWEQEVRKATAVTLAQQNLEVARLSRQAAEETKQKDILLGQGEAERKRLVMGADGALTQKLETYENVMGMWATAFQNFGGPLVPSVVMGGNGEGQQAGGSAIAFMNMLTIQAARELAVNVKVGPGG